MQKCGGKSSSSSVEIDSSLKQPNNLSLSPIFRPIFLLDPAIIRENSLHRNWSPIIPLHFSCLQKIEYSSFFRSYSSSKPDGIQKHYMLLHVSISSLSSNPLSRIQKHTIIISQRLYKLCPRIQPSEARRRRTRE